MTESPKRDDLYEQRERTLEWVTSKWTKSKHCPICNSTTWSVGNIVELRQFNGGDLVIGGPSGGLYPAAQIICQVCGFTHFFNAVIAGLVENSKGGTTGVSDE